MSVPPTDEELAPCVLGVGLVNKDVVAVVPHWEWDQKAEATALFEQVGGPVPVALQTIARLGSPLPLRFVGVTGNDCDGSDVTGWLDADGVDTFHCPRPREASTSKSLVLLDARDGARTLANYAGHLPPLRFGPVHELLFATTRLLHLDGRDLPASLRAAERVRAAGGEVSLDLGSMRPGREELVARCDIVIASRKGGAGLFPDAAADPEEQVRRLLDRGPRVAGVTLGPEGVVIGAAGERPVRLPAYPVPDARDTCGAGDCFHGAFLWAWLDGRDPVECATWAQAAVAFRIRRYGNREGLPSREQVEIFLVS